MWGLIIVLLILLTLLIVAYQVAKKGENVLCNIPVVGGIICGAGSGAAGGIPSCKGDTGDGLTSCCAPVIASCIANCSGNTDPNACLYACADQRGCASKLDCKVFGTYSTGLLDQHKCGDPDEGGAACQKDCCASQAKYCAAVATGVAGNATKVKCMTDRGCQGSDLPCSAFGNYAINAGETDKAGLCGGVNLGGAACASACSAAQVAFCSSDSIPTNAAKVQCMRDRGADPAALPCSAFGTFSVTANDKSNYCGTTDQGGSGCKAACCGQQKTYCDAACSFLAPANCHSDCMAQRGCGPPSLSALGRVRNGFKRMLSSVR